LPIAVVDNHRTYKQVKSKHLIQ